MKKVSKRTTEDYVKNMISVGAYISRKNQGERVKGKRD